MVQAKLRHNQQTARRNNTAHPYLLRVMGSPWALHMGGSPKAGRTTFAEGYSKRFMPDGMRNADRAIFLLISSKTWSGRMSARFSSILR